jgi:Asp-tRNA(Asn)/Glu-tRNA(Gln) amidotransferase C subunit
MNKSELKRLCTLNPLEMADRLNKLETQLATIQDMFSDALQSDLEHGVKCLNENASKEFHEKYPELTQALCRLSDL